MLAPKVNQPGRSGLFLLSPASEDPDAYGHTAAHVRLRLRKWEARRAWAAGTLIALSFPLAYLLIMFASGQHAPVAAARVLIWLWVAALTVAIACAEAVWRNRFRLERIVAERQPGFPT